MKRLVTTIQLLLAGTFFISAICGAVFGPEAQERGLAEIQRQGFPATYLADHGLAFDENALNIVLPILIAIGLAILALKGNRVISLVVHPILIVLGATIMAAQVFIESSVQSYLENTTVDVPALVAAAKSAFPAWYPVNVYARFILATVGSLVVIVVLVWQRNRERAALAKL